MMKALLVAMNAKYIHSNLGIYSIRSYGIYHGIAASDLEMAEYTINQRLEDVLADIYRRHADLVAFSCYIWNIREIVELAEALHQVSPETVIWFGGPEVSYRAEELMKEYNFLSGIMSGEGEETFLELYQAYEQGTSLQYVKGLIYREFETDAMDTKQADMYKIIRTESRPLLDMDALIFPYRDMKELEHRIIYYESSRGCPFGCSYCLSSVDRRVRLRGIRLVEEELQFFLDQRVAQVKFVDRTFNCEHEHAMAIWKYIYEHDNGITNFHFELSADLLQEEEIEYMKNFRPGLVQFEIGVQSTNSDTMKAIHRPGDLRRLRSRVTEIHRAKNIHQHLDLIAGLPYEDYESFKRSYNDVHAMEPDQLQLGFLKLLKGSPIEKEQEEFGIVSGKQPPYEVLQTPWLPYADLLRLKQVEEMTERYYNSLQFEASRRYMEGLFETPFDFYQSLGEYFQIHDYVRSQQSRMQNYQILLEFLEEEKKGNADILKQLMSYDLYARENLKSRPYFAKDNSDSQWRQAEQIFYQTVGKSEKYLPGYQAYEWKQILRMTHLECFDYDVIQYLEEGRLECKKSVLLFDYQQRNPLNKQARVVDVTEELLLQNE